MMEFGGEDIVDELVQPTGTVGAQHYPIGANDQLPPVSTVPEEGPTDPWDKDCVLTLDGGGIRGYASLWMLKILMDAIAEIETNDRELERHDSSFNPRSEQTAPPNGSTDHSNDQQTQTPVEERSRANSARSRLFPWRNTTRRVSPETGASNESGNGTEVVRDAGFLPCHYFDYVAGTSTGGLNAIMLGRLRMPVEDCLKRYPTMAKEVFTKKKRSVATRIRKGTTTKYDSVPLETNIRNIVESRATADKAPRQPGYAFGMYPSPPDLCKTLVIANELTQLDGGTVEAPYKFRTYPIPLKNALPDRTEIWKVARATSAADTYFDAMIIDGKEYSDGGVGNNNPVHMTLRDVQDIRGKDSFEKAVCVLVSIGAGQKSTRRARVENRLPSFIANRRAVRQISRLARRLVSASTNTEPAHRHMVDLATSVGFQHYYRWTGGEEVSDLGLDEWQPKQKGNKLPTAKFIEENVKSYMQLPEIKAEIDECARALVDRRRARVRHYPERGRWRRHTYCTVLHCPFCPEDEPSYLETRESAKSHIERMHTGITDVENVVGELKDVHPRYPGGPL